IFRVAAPTEIRLEYHPVRRLDGAQSVSGNRSPQGCASTDLWGSLLIVFENLSIVISISGIYDIIRWTERWQMNDTYYPGYSCIFEHFQHFPAGRIFQW